MKLWAINNPIEAQWLKEFRLLSELGHVPKDPLKFEFFSQLLNERDLQNEKGSSDHKLQSLIQKNK